MICAGCGGPVGLWCERLCCGCVRPYTYRDFATAYWLETNPSMLARMPWRT